MSILFELFANAIHGLALHRLSTKLLAGLIVIAAVSCGYFAAEMGNLDIGGQGDDVLAGLPRVVMSYAIGMLLSRILRDRPPPALPSWTAPLTLPLAIGAVGLLPGQTWPAEMAFAVLVCPGVVVAGLSWDAGRAGTMLGAWSFPLYAFHAPIIYGAKSFGLNWAAVLCGVVILSAMPFAFQRLRDLWLKPHHLASSGLVQ